MAKAKILVVEDERIVAEDIKTSLQKLGYTVSGTAISGEEAVKKAEDIQPDLVLMDIVLGGEMDGVEAASIIRSRFDIPVVYLTAYAYKKMLERAKVTEPFGYILKPFEDKELNSILEIALYKIKMEKKLKETQEWLSATLKSIGEALVATDTKGCVTFMNPVAELLTGWKQKDALGKHLKNVFNIISAKTGKKIENPVSKVVGKEAIIDLANQSLLIAKDRTEIAIDASGAPIRDERGRITGTVLVFRDITERKRMAKIKDEFISSVSHELRTPLSITKEAISLVLDRVQGEINEQQDRMLAIAKKNINRLARIIDSLLDISKIEAGKVELRKTRIDVTSTIKMVVSSFDSKAREKDLELRIKCPRDGIHIYADEGKIIKLLTNLVDNSIKFTSEGSIQISAKEKEDAVECTVADTGIGIPREDLPEVFDKFKQFGRKEGPGEKGTGLGLSIAKGIVELHKGKIWVESEKGKGAKFIFSLPKLRSEEIFKQYLLDEIREAKEKGKYLCVIMISIRNFKELIQDSRKKANDALKKMESVIRNSLRRSSDIVIANDSGEILLILPETRGENAISVLERIKEKLRQYLSQQKHLKGKINLGTGVISYPEEAIEEENVLNEIRKAVDG